jgi:hypothetical protein
MYIELYIINRSIIQRFVPFYLLHFYLKMMLHIFKTPYKYIKKKYKI